MVKRDQPSMQYVSFDAAHQSETFPQGVYRYRRLRLNKDSPGGTSAKGEWEKLFDFQTLSKDDSGTLRTELGAEVTSQDCRMPLAKLLEEVKI